MTLTLPLPTASHNPNSRAHWRKKAAAKKEARNIGKLITLEALKGQPAPPFTGYTLTFFHKQNRNRDDDNFAASFKAYRDGIADALRIDDNILKMKETPLMLLDPTNPRLEVRLHA